MSEYHNPVLLKESVDALVTSACGTYADATFGGGGHSREIISRLSPEARIGRFFHLPAPNSVFLARNGRFFLLPALFYGILARIGWFPIRDWCFRQLVPRGTPFRVAFEAFFVLFLWRYPL